MCNSVVKAKAMDYHPDSVSAVILIAVTDR